VNLFFPSGISIAAGQSLAFQVQRRAVGIHTVTLGPAPPAGGFNPLAAFPSDPLPLPDYTGSNHGDGFLNSGLLDGDATSPFPDSVVIRFTAPGSYTVVDVLHPGMEATVDVNG
jgi:plastocyanin